MGDILRPTLDEISAIIRKLENLESIRQNLLKTPLVEHPKIEEAEFAEFSEIKRLIERLACQGQESEIIDADLLFAPDKIKRNLPNLSITALIELADLLENKGLGDIQSSVISELEKKIREAEMKRWGQHTKELIRDVGLSLRPWHAYLISLKFDELATLDFNNFYLNALCFNKCPTPDPSLNQIIQQLQAVRLIRESEIEAAEKQAEPASTKQNAPLVKHWKITAWFKELYGLTIERIVKAFLDKYG